MMISTNNSILNEKGNKTTFQLLKGKRENKKAKTMAFKGRKKETGEKANAQLSNRLTNFDEDSVNVI